MRLLRPVRANPWPHDMLITVEDRPRQLLELLWIREAHALDPVGDDLPPLLVETPEPAAKALDDATRAGWGSAWTRIWDRAVTHAGRDQDPSVFARLADLTPDERESALRSIVGPGWGEEHGRDVFEDPSWVNWDRRSTDAFLASRPDELRLSPERRVLDALEPAWRAGLTKIVTIPCRGEYSRRASVNALLVADSARADGEQYRAALRAFL